MEHTENKGNALAERDEADHHGQDGGQQAHDLIKDAGKHRAGHNGGQASSSSRFLITFLLSKGFMVAGRGIEPRSTGSEPVILPIDHPAMSR